MKILFIFITFLSYSISSVTEECVAHIQNNFKNLSSEQIEFLSIGAPEIMRFNMVQNFIETEILELAYVQFGPEAVDFSIGPFQMRPSFVERLEMEVLTNHDLRKYSEITEFSTKNNEEIRKERIDRISDPRFQLLYLEVFSKYCDIHYHILNTLSQSEQLKFKSAVYNIGFDQSAETIISFQSKKYFPHGSKYEGTQYSFSELSLNIYSQLEHDAQHKQ